MKFPPAQVVNGTLTLVVAGKENAVDAVSELITASADVYSQQLILAHKRTRAN